ncbi:DUF1311 domain-containing protein [Candidatus Liberibacter africanus]|uniref:Lysozyme inhibitor LprI-like N-terminal domain-containing protein n=1 Tax=Candidatus Liberibacter africanus PTSAPSY TaxID=1277257 RepID=A0A0G3I4V3_LIBAF|nr:lysozyme inhibitor LprI family protein [Candidatus Liberibacter africanus]AKK20300.1 hypothetical protein G293_03360 [Candidatus Liberibacter africanus PTSAPSY]QTP64055.1 DUF1311 domain-containing protein [Candidatus Liberibacter africanus]
MFKKNIFLLTIIIALQSMALTDETYLDQNNMNDNETKTLQSVQEELNETYKKVLNKIEGHQKQLFEKSHDSWEKYRDSECDFTSSGLEGGSAKTMIYTNCLQDHTIQRNEKLTSYLTCPEGDLSCPFINNE